MTPYMAVALTSLVAYFIAVKRLGWRPSDLGRALGRMAGWLPGQDSNLRPSD